MSAAHSPIPWTLRSPKAIYAHGAERVAICHNDEQPIFDCGGGIQSHRELEIARANAAHIVRAVNNHDALVAALRNARTQISALGTPDDANNNAVLAECDSALAAAEAP